VVLTLINVSCTSSYDNVTKFSDSIVIEPLAPTTRDFTGLSAVYPALFLFTTQKKYVSASIEPPDVVVMVGTVRVLDDA
jgi:hypothetical protein